jgi:predicted regulator of Ras-like GTPase activity (Roadblock/LC7/MglB family)
MPFRSVRDALLMYAHRRAKRLTHVLALVQLGVDFTRCTHAIRSEKTFAQRMDPHAAAAGTSDAHARVAEGDDEAVVALLDALVDRAGSIIGAVLASADGLPIASVAPASLSATRLSAMGSALLGLCDAAAGESHIGACNDVIVDAAEGRLLAMSVNYRNAPAVLLAVGSPGAPLGHVLWTTRNCAQAIVQLR